MTSTLLLLLLWWRRLGVYCVALRPGRTTLAVIESKPSQGDDWTDRQWMTSQLLLLLHQETD